ncbi:MAG: hypothetical protein M0Z94_00935 [Dehalococcoidales bacterium]|nr:hypothetical protein [Dehalococcoidales bacterium]
MERETMVNPVGDTIVSLAIVGVAGYVAYALLKDKLPSGFMWPSPDTAADCVPPFDRAYWSQRLRELMANNKYFWCRVHEYVKVCLKGTSLFGIIVIPGSGPEAARDWAKFSAYIQASDGYDPGLYGPAEFFAYAIQQSGGV